MYKFLLRTGIPVISVFILVYCTWIFFCPIAIDIKHGNMSVGKFLKALVDSRDYYIQMYILVKGVFCSTILFVVGKYFEGELEKKNKAL
jgi:hypothetical protein